MNSGLFKNVIYKLYIYTLYIYMYISSSSSSYRTGSTDIHDPLSPLLPIVHRLPPQKKEKGKKKKNDEINILPHPLTRTVDRLQNYLKFSSK